MGYCVQGNEVSNSAKFKNFIDFLNILCEEYLQHWTLYSCSFSEVSFSLTTRNSNAAYKMKKIPQDCGSQMVTAGFTNSLNT
jgi:hypothetical protein